MANWTVQVSKAYFVLSNAAVFSIQNLGFHCTEVHRLRYDAVVPWGYVLSHWKCKEAIGIFPINQNEKHLCNYCAEYRKNKMQKKCSDHIYASDMVCKFILGTQMMRLHTTSKLLILFFSLSFQTAIFISAQWLCKAGNSWPYRFWRDYIHNTALLMWMWCQQSTVNLTAAVPWINDWINCIFKLGKSASLELCQPECY